MICCSIRSWIHASTWYLEVHNGVNWPQGGKSANIHMWPCNRMLQCQTDPVIQRKTHARRGFAGFACVNYGQVYVINMQVRMVCSCQSRVGADYCYSNHFVRNRLDRLLDILHLYSLWSEWPPSLSLTCLKFMHDLVVSCSFDSLT